MKGVSGPCHLLRSGAGGWARSSGVTPEGNGNEAGSRAECVGLLMVGGSWQSPDVRLGDSLKKLPSG